MTFFRSESGAFAPLFAIAIFAILASIGVAVDYSVASSTKATSQGVADSMALAAAKSISEDQNKKNAKKVGRDFFKANLLEAADNKSLSPKIEIKNNNKHYTVTATITGEVKTAFMGLFGIKSLPIEVTAETNVDLLDTEIVLVVDVSFSMAQRNRLTNVIAAINQFITQVYPDGKDNPSRRMSIIPFGESVRLGMSYNTWLENAYRTPLGTVKRTASFNPQPALDAYYNKIGMNAPTLKRNKPITPPYPFVGCFQHEPNNQIRDGRTGSVSPGNYLPYVQQTFSGSFPYCPGAESEALLFQSNPKVLTKRVNALTLSFGTSTDIGLLWGYRAILPDWRGKFKDSSSHPLSYSKDSRKYLILLTDGMTNRFSTKGDGQKGSGTGRNPAGKNFESLCKTISNNKNINLFSIGYDLIGKDKGMEVLLKKCVGGEGSFQNASTSNITSVLNQVASKINHLYLSH
ncbi:MAG: TadE/TadG family type IV pilus assembly protein [Salaquimonas sp.]